MSARDLIPFSFEGHSIRVVTGDDGQPLFVGKDVCEALGYVDPTTAMRSHCKGVQKRHPLQTAGGVQELRVLNEADVLRLIVSSTLLAAQAFERLVFEEILPTIRRTGSYTAAGTDPLAGLPPEQRALVGLMLDQAAIKHQLEAQGTALATVDQRVTDMADSMLMLTRPSGAESIVHIRARINALYGLPARIVDEVMRQSPIAPKPAGMVKSSHAEALGGSYAVYWVKDVSTVFARFVGECRHATATQAVHPYITGRFKLSLPRDRPPPGSQSPLKF